MLRAAVADRLIPADPSVGVTLRRPGAAMVLPTPAQVRRLLEEADRCFVAFVALAAFAGLRLGDAAALRVADVDFENRTLDVRRQVQRANGGLVEIRPPKYGSERVVYLAPFVVEHLARHIAEHSPGRDPGRRIFPGEGGKPWHQNSVGYWRATR